MNDAKKIGLLPYLEGGLVKTGSFIPGVVLSVQKLKTK